MYVNGFTRFKGHVKFNLKLILMIWCILNSVCNDHGTKHKNAVQCLGIINSSHFHIVKVWAIVQSGGSSNGQFWHTC